VNDHSQDNPQQDSKAPEGPRPFSDEPWQVLVGIRQRTDADPMPNPHGVIVGMSATPEVFVPTAHGDRPDKTIAAVHFGIWLDKHLPKLMGLWEVEYAQYMNLARRSPVGRPPELALVDTQGQRLSTGTTQ
jgi:hypothetical protein